MLISFNTPSTPKTTIEYGSPNNPFLWDRPVVSTMRFVHKSSEIIPCPPCCVTTLLHSTSVICFHHIFGKVRVRRMAGEGGWWGGGGGGGVEARLWSKSIVSSHCGPLDLRAVSTLGLASLCQTQTDTDRVALVLFRGLGVVTQQMAQIKNGLGPRLVPPVPDTGSQYWGCQQRPLNPTHPTSATRMHPNNSCSR